VQGRFEIQVVQRVDTKGIKHRKSLVKKDFQLFPQHSPHPAVDAFNDESNQIFKSIKLTGEER
jgi:hypothetical protein